MKSAFGDVVVAVGDVASVQVERPERSAGTDLACRARNEMQEARYTTAKVLLDMDVTCKRQMGPGFGERRRHDLPPLEPEDFSPEHCGAGSGPEQQRMVKVPLAMNDLVNLSILIGMIVE